MITMRRESTGIPGNWRYLLWGALCLLLALPLVAMRFTKEVVWDLDDFVAAGLLLGCLGISVELAFRASSRWKIRALIVSMALGAVMLIWANAAVGIF